MSILRGDFAPDQVAAIEVAMESTGLPFASAVRMLIDYGINARQGYRMATESLPGETSKEEGEVETPESQDPTVIETERKGSGGNGESVSVPKRSRKIPVAIPDPPTEIDSPELRAFLPEFVEYRRKVKKSPLAPEGWKLLFNRLKPAGREHAVLALRYSISNNWKSFDVEWLKGKSWATIASELGLSLEAEKPAPSPADLAARNLSRALDKARSKILTKIALAEDGWTSKSRTVFFEDLDACKSEAEVTAHLAACRALCDRLRAMGAFPLRRPTQPGEILPAGSGGPLAVNLRRGWVAVDGSLMPPPVSGAPLTVASLPEPLVIGCGRGCPVGGPCAFWPEPCPAQFLSVTTVVDGDAPTLAFDLFVKTSPEGPAARIESLATASDFCPCGAPMIDDGDGGTTCIEDCQRPACRICGCPIDRSAGGGLCAECKAPKLDCNTNPPTVTMEATLSLGDHELRKTELQRSKVADGQHAFEGHYLQSVYCIHCGMPRDHIRHYLPRELPFTVKEES